MALKRGKRPPSRVPKRYNPATVAKTIKAAMAAGMQPFRVEVSAEGNITLTPLDCVENKGDGTKCPAI